MESLHAAGLGGRCAAAVVSSCRTINPEAMITPEEHKKIQATVNGVCALRYALEHLQIDADAIVDVLDFAVESTKSFLSVTESNEPKVKDVKNEQTLKRWQVQHDLRIKTIICETFITKLRTCQLALKYNKDGQYKIPKDGINPKKFNLN
jgi:hypothetical protein